jgi:hypothetical protein
MKLEFIGPKVVIRRIGEIEWSEERGFVQEVPVNLGADLLSGSSAQFALADASDDEIRELSELFGITQKEVKSMIVEKPKASLKSEPSVRDKIKED